MELLKRILDFFKKDIQISLVPKETSNIKLHFTLRFTENGEKKFNEMRDRLGFSNSSEVVMSALGLIESCSIAISEEKIIALLDEETGEFVEIDIRGKMKSENEEETREELKPKLFLVYSKDNPLPPED